MINLYIMRHGETVLNRFNRIQGWADSPLTKLGEKQSVEGGALLANIHFDAVYTSDMQRTIKTAQKALSQNKNNPPILKPGLPKIREFYFGHFEGLEAAPAWKAVFKSLGGKKNTLSDILNTFHELDKSQTSENFAHFSKRIDSGLEIILNENKETKTSNILIVTHALTINYILQALFPKKTDLVISENGSVVHVVYEDEVFSLVE